MTDIDTHLVVEIRLVVSAPGFEDVREIGITRRRQTWARIALGAVRDISDEGGLPGSDRSLVTGYRVRAVAELRCGEEVDVTRQFLADGWQTWLRCDRDMPWSASAAARFRSSPERDARIRADDELAGCTPLNEQRLDQKLDAALAAEDAAMLARAAMIGAPVEAPDHVELRATEETHADPTPALDHLDRHHATAVAAARTARVAAEVAETSALAAFLAAQEGRRAAQAELDEVLAVGELFEGPGVDGGPSEAEGGDILQAPDGPKDADAPEVFLQDVPGSERPVPPETEDDRNWLRFAA